MTVLIDNALRLAAATRRYNDGVLDTSTALFLASLGVDLTNIDEMLDVIDGADLLDDGDDDYNAS